MSAMLFMVNSVLFAQLTTEQKNNDSINRLDKYNMKIGYWEEKSGEFLMKGEYSENVKVGNWISCYINSMPARLEYFSKGLKDGISIQFDRKGKITQIDYYKKGMLHGSSITYSQFNESPTSEANYLYGKKNGVARLYYDNNKLQEESYYRDDMKDGTSKWFNKSGRTIAIYNYKMGNFDGLQKTFYENDSVQTIVTYKDNVKSGPYKELFRTGMVKTSGQYINDLQEGTWTEFDETGKAIKIQKYKAGITK